MNDFLFNLWCYESGYPAHHDLDKLNHFCCKQNRTLLYGNHLLEVDVLRKDGIGFRAVETWCLLGRSDKDKGCKQDLEKESRLTMQTWRVLISSFFTQAPSSYTACRHKVRFCYLTFSTKKIYTVMNKFSKSYVWTSTLSWKQLWVDITLVDS